MALDPDRLLKRDIEPIAQSYGPTDAALYALGLGLGLDLADEAALDYVVAPDRVLPTFATVLAQNRDWYGQADTGLDLAGAVHAFQAIHLHAPLPSATTVIGKARVEDVIDKGAARGAMIVSRTTICDALDGALYATMEQGVLFRHDGGFGGLNAHPGARVTIPTRPPDVTFVHLTSHQTALIYRLSGDRNPLHSNPSVARKAGFKRPILHGLASFGIACYAITQSFGTTNPSALRSMSCWFTAPAYPGDTLSTQLWREDSAVKFRCLCAETGTVIMDHGHAELV